jgi:hypothetical protein
MQHDYRYWRLIKVTHFPLKKIEVGFRQALKYSLGSYSLAEKMRKIAKGII